MTGSIDFGAVFEASPYPAMLLDRDLRYVAVNHAYLQVTGARRDELIGISLFDAFPHDPANPANESAMRLRASLERARDAGEPDHLPLIHYRVGGEDRFWSATHTPIRDEGGRVRYVLQHTVDITELRRNEIEAAKAGVMARVAALQERHDSLDEALRSLRAAEVARAETQRITDVLATAFAEAPVAVAVLSGPDYVVAFANDAACHAWNRARDVVLGRPIFAIVPELAEQGLRGLLDGVRATGKRVSGEALRVETVRHDNREEAWFDFTCHPLVDDTGTVHGVVVIASDVTQNVVARRELEGIFDAFPEAIFFGDSSGLKRVNHAAQRILGFDRAEDFTPDQPKLVRDLRPRNVETGAPIAAADTPFARALRGLETRTAIAIDTFTSNEERILFCSAAPLPGPNGTFSAIVTQIDVTEQHRAQSEAIKLAKVLDATRDFVGIADVSSGAVTFANHAALELLGLPDVETARQKRFVEYFVPADRDRVANEGIPAAIATGHWEAELHLEHQITGEIIPISYTLFPVRDVTGRITSLATITRDMRAARAIEAERAELLEKEKVARESAELANRLKDQFLATVSHELRTPLTSILGWMQMIKSGKLTAEKHARAIDTVERNARVQAQLIEDLLDVSRIMSGKLSLEIEPTDLGHIASAAAETVRPAAETKGVLLDVAIDSLEIVSGDARRLQQVVWNLLANSVKFTPAGGRVSLRARRQGDHVEIVVADTGAGIAPDFLPHVFERFRQAESGMTRNMGGLGLGLSIVKHVVDAHGGSVRAESEGLGRGATFVVSLPALSTQLASSASPRGEGDAFDVPRGLEGLKVLVVDDEEDAREYIRTLLQECKVEVTLASNVSEAIASLEREPPDLLLSDIAMPGEDGYGLIRRVRALPAERGGRVPAVALTAFARAEDRARAMRAGFHNHVAKPVTPEELLAVVAALAPGQ